jgi:hypothetical protein
MIIVTVKWNPQYIVLKPVHNTPFSFGTLRKSNVLSFGWGRVLVPNAFYRKYPKASADWRWHWVFPQKNRWTNVQAKKQGRNHRR